MTEAARWSARPHPWTGYAYAIGIIAGIAIMLGAIFL